LGRLSLVAALAIDPELLILDEPTAGLDPVVRRDFAEAVIDFTADGERTVLLSSHLLHEVERLAEHVAILDRGRILLDASVDEIKRDLMRVTARFDQPPAALDMPRLAAHCTGDAWHLIDRAPDELAREEILARLRALGAVDIEVGDSSLDSIFVDLVGGRAHA
ncbi:MAG: AAA family ATPase, partial [Acidobacteriota bacterium]